ncbi:MAG: hypothetical protein QX199_08235 [Methylococcaceae bacterium]
MSNIYGTSANDNITGTGLNDLIYGYGGDDTLDGGLGDDELDGSGNGKVGNDTVSYQKAASAVVVNLQLGTATGGAGKDTLVNIANILAGQYNDTLIGDENANKLYAGKGNDSIDDTGGGNLIDAGDGNDRIAVYSSKTGDISTITGGAGSDTYSLNLSGVQQLVITDFTGGAGGDIFDISTLAANSTGYTAGNPFGTLGYLRLQTDQADTLLQWDPDGASSNANDWQTLARLQNVTADALAAVNFTPLTSPTGENSAPTLTAFTSVIASGNEDSEMTVGFADLQAQGNEADIDGTVDSFVIKALSSGSLKIGASAATATAWNAATNNSVDTTHNAYWTPTANANGSLNAFTAVAKDNDDSESADAIQATIAVTAVNDAPTGKVTITGAASPGQTLSAANTLADADGLGAISYTWKTGTTVLGTGSTYTIAQAVIGKSIAVTASYTDLQGSAETVISAATSEVSPSSPAFIVAKNDLFTAEDGDSAVISLSLATAPSREVSVTFTSSDVTEGSLTNPTLTFNSSNWSTAQSFTVVGKNDYLNDGNQPYIISAVVNSSDVNYRQIAINPIVITNKEDATTVSDARIPAGTARDMPIKLYGDTQVDTTIIIDGFFKPISSFNANDVLQGLDGNDTLYGGNLQDDLSGGIGNDMLYGENDEDFLYGEDGNDTLYGQEDNDRLEGGSGNDTLDGGLGVDTMIGGVGNDTYYLGYDAVDVINDNGLATDSDTVIMPYQLTRYTLPAGIENATITDGAKGNLTGNDSNNDLAGNGGNNTLSGAVGRDSLFGGSGNDMLLGGTGNDTLSGGNGKDIFKFNAALTANTDKITDFSVADDTIQLENSIFTKLSKTGVLNAGLFVKAAAAHDVNDYVIYNPATGALSYDADGSGAGSAVPIAVLGINLPLTFADFVVI